MANNLSDSAENSLLNHLLGETSMTFPTVVNVALFTSDPGESGDMTNEIVATGSTGYLRVPWTGSAASGGASTNDADLVFPANGSVTSYTVTHVAIVIGGSTTRNTGTVVMSGPITNKTIATGDQYRIPSGSLALSLT